jgi:sec-independent protein translocase protein TatA
MLAEIFGPDLLIVVLVVVVVLFGGAAIPKLARNLGSAKKEFEKGIKDGSNGETPSIAQASNAQASNGSGSATPRSVDVPQAQNPPSETSTA